MAALAVPLAVASGAFASVTYNLTLTDATAPTYSGTGAITLSSAPSATGVTNYTPSQVSGLSFTIDGQTFSQSGSGASLSAVQFINGALTDITFSQEIGTSPNRYDLQTSSGYAFYYNNEQSLASGTITAAPAAATPEPASAALLISALGFLSLRRRRS